MFGVAGTWYRSPMATWCARVTDTMAQRPWSGPSLPYGNPRAADHVLADRCNYPHWQGRDIL